MYQSGAYLSDAKHSAAATMLRPSSCVLIGMQESPKQTPAALGIERVKPTMGARVVSSHARRFFQHVFDDIQMHRMHLFSLKTWRTQHVPSQTRHVLVKTRQACLASEDFQSTPLRSL